MSTGPAQTEAAQGQAPASTPAASDPPKQAAAEPTLADLLRRVEALEAHTGIRRRPAS